MWGHMEVKGPKFRAQKGVFWASSGPLRSAFARDRRIIFEPKMTPELCEVLRGFLGIFGPFLVIFWLFGPSRPLSHDLAFARPCSYRRCSPFFQYLHCSANRSGAIWPIVFSGLIIGFAGRKGVKWPRLIGRSKRVWGNKM